MKKVKAFFKGQKGKKLLVIAMTVVVMAMSCVNCFAAETTVDTSAVYDGIESVFGTVSDIFSFSNIIAGIGIAIGSSALLTLGWFGLRKVIRMIQTALKKGKVSV